MSDPVVRITIPEIKGASDILELVSKAHGPIVAIAAGNKYFPAIEEKFKEASANFRKWRWLCGLYLGVGGAWCIGMLYSPRANLMIQVLGAWAGMIAYWFVKRWAERKYPTHKEFDWSYEITLTAKDLENAEITMAAEMIANHPELSGENDV